MGLKFDVDLDKTDLEFKVSTLDVAKGDSIDWTDLVNIRDRIDRALEQRDRIRRQQSADARRATA